MKKKYELRIFIYPLTRSICMLFIATINVTLPSSTQPLSTVTSAHIVTPVTLSTPANPTTPVPLIQATSPTTQLNKIHNMIIIGSGPAGLTAGIYAARAQLSPIVIEGQNPNGQLINATKIENWPGIETISGFELTSNLREQAQKFGTQFLAEYITKVDFSKKPFTLWTNTNTELKAHTIIIATGTEPKKLYCPGEEKYFGKGVAICATCDAPFYKDKQVIVVGTGDTAMRNISLLKKFTKKITVIENESSSSRKDTCVGGDPDIKIICNSSITQINGDEKQVLGADIVDNITGKTDHIQADGIFVSIGSRANTALFVNQIKLDKNGYIQVNNQTNTSVPGVFAAGTVFDYIYKQAITCVAGGCMAALDAQRYLNALNEK